MGYGDSFFGCGSRKEFVNIWCNVMVSKEGHYNAIAPFVRCRMGILAELLTRWCAEGGAHTLRQACDALLIMGTRMKETNTAFGNVYWEHMEKEIRELYDKRRTCSEALVKIQKSVEKMREISIYRKRLDELIQELDEEYEKQKRFGLVRFMSNAELMHESLLNPQFVVSLTGINPEGIVGMPAGAATYAAYKKNYFESVTTVCKERGCWSPVVLDVVEEAMRNLDSALFVGAWKRAHPHSVLVDVRAKMEEAMRAAGDDAVAKAKVFLKMARATFEQGVALTQKTPWGSLLMTQNIQDMLKTWAEVSTTMLLLC